MFAARGAAMEKNLCIASMSVAGLLLLLFVLDMALNIPFGGLKSPFMVIDIVGAVAGLILLYLSWNALRDRFSREFPAVELLPQRLDEGVAIS